MALSSFFVTTSTRRLTSKASFSSFSPFSSLIRKIDLPHSSHRISSSFVQVKRHFSLLFSEKLDDRPKSIPRIKPKIRTLIPRVGGLYEDYYIQYFETCINNSNWLKLRDLYDRAKDAGVFTIEMYSTLILGCLRGKNFQEMAYYFSQLKQSGLIPPQEIYHAMIFCYAQFGCFKQVLDLKDEMEFNSIKPTLNIYSSLLQACALSYHYELIPILASEAEKENVIDDVVAYPLVVKICQITSEYYFLQLIQSYLDNTFMCNLVIGYHCYKGEMEKAVTVLKTMKPPATANNLTYGFLIIGSIKVGKVDEAMKYYDQYKDGRPGVHVLQALLKLADDPKFYNNAKRVWNDIMKNETAVGERLVEDFTLRALANGDVELAQTIAASDYGSQLSVPTRSKCEKKGLF